MADEDEYLKKQTGGGYTRQARSVRASRTAVEKGRARDAIARQVDHLGHVAQVQVVWAREAGAYVVDSVTKAPHHAKEAFSHETEHIAKEKKGNLERLVKQETAALRLAALKSEVVTKKAAKQVAAKVRDAYGTAERFAENISAKVVETGKGAEKTADEKVKTIKKAAQDHVENAAEMSKVSFDSTRISADRIVMRGNDQADKAQGFAAQKIKVVEQSNYVKDDMKHKAHVAMATSKASLAAMLAGMKIRGPKLLGQSCRTRLTTTLKPPRILEMGRTVKPTWHFSRTSETGATRESVSRNSAMHLWIPSKKSD
ncbi:MAG: hypothetical protein J3Q66DRAFT_402517 [Benniella sp.]|nr:MAG: hypothetical protein J3Q66DRAFT_402517 [Benniella sp.]